jgi:hypothetical protein
LCENWKERDHYETLNIAGWIMLIWILERLDLVIWIGLVWLRIETGGGLLGT